jgi:predicted nucleic acid-binding protein
MVTSDSFLIADTSGLISLAVKSDRNHEAAVAATERLKGKQSNILVLYEILVETVNVLGKRVGMIRAQQYGYIYLQLLFL